jgi:glucose-1-phosphate cytidylyltransferase
MKVVILAGGLGTRISEETENKPKPMVLIDDKPIIWHLMNIFSTQGYSEFILALGYRSDVIKRWLVDLNDLDGSIKIDTASGSITKITSTLSTNWTVHALETGLTSLTGERIRQCMEIFAGEKLIVTYGDGLGNISIKSLLDFHSNHGKLATVTAVRPPARFGYMQIENGQVSHFGEKNQADEGWISGGFFVLEPEVISYINNENESFESGAIPRLVSDNQLMAYQHTGFWQPMDTLREKQELTKMAQTSNPPWLAM